MEPLFNLSVTEAELVQRLHEFYRRCLTNGASAINGNASVQSLLDISVGWGWTNGILMLHEGTSPLSARLAPFTLLPTLVRRVGK